MEALDVLFPSEVNWSLRGLGVGFRRVNSDLFSAPLRCHGFQLLAHMFIFFGQPDLLRIRRVSKRFAAVVDDNGRGWFRRVGGSPSAHVESPSDPISDDWPGPSMPDTSLRALLDRIHGVEHLIFGSHLGRTVPSPSTFAVLFLRHRTTLLSIDLTPSLAKVDLAPFSLWPALAADHEIPLPNLCSFRILCAHSSRSPPSSNSAALLPKLMESVYRSPTLVDLALLNLPRHLPPPPQPVPLTSLRLSSPVYRARTFVPDDPWIPSHFPGLLSLDLSGCDNVFDPDLAALLRGLPSLKRLVHRGGEDGAGLFRSILSDPTLGERLEMLDLQGSLADAVGTEYDARRKSGLAKAAGEARAGLEIRWGYGEIWAPRRGGD
ncbi:hypothetical protein DFJ74DRAFT_654593 [Hyaloraphidium curvatum]|nr:hypothetical protein DFJ74DRAFT_654593 [Hyaloraphidium curvatum]